MLRRDRRQGHQEASAAVGISRKGLVKSGANEVDEQDKCRGESNTSNQVPVNV